MKYAIFCAFNPKNSGMYSVDLAARSFFSDRGFSFDLCVTQGAAGLGDLRFRKIDDTKQLRDYGAIVFWGDFQNNPMWGRRYFPFQEIKHGRARSPEHAFNIWRDTYLRIHRVLPDSTRIHSIGGCFLGAHPYLDDPETATAMHEFLERTDDIVVRDPESLQCLLDFRKAGACDISLGFDVASLLHPVAHRTPQGGDYFVYAFARTLNEADGHCLAKAVGRVTGLRPVSIDWLTSRWPRHFTHRAFRRNLALMRGAAFAITDVYHFAINCMVQGTVPVCLSLRSNEDRGALTEHKKELLYRMIECTALHIEVQSSSILPGEECRLAERIAQFFDSGANAGSYLATFERLRSRLSEQVSSLLRP